ncbi:phosphatidylinositol 4-phosphate 3-kinase C2 domain-containing subunit alpha-like protein [Dinothrombium tinctorium]|uniref:Phosphatidylinositol 4-phosphate 3-kinase C2 domain-containing subunit alpha-like protein n=1 Tax=Dinothrombium tinctorium TaxID=1965070 RepID=A0A3S3PPC6_9ACAR|nr:phosphatidylinositol 4-phosphate 3-kinase C2 domain-containing subunit alpha-like protein [Dinothrombium tinctorium]
MSDEKDTVNVPPLPPRRTVHSLCRNRSTKSELDRIIPPPPAHQTVDNNIFANTFDAQLRFNTRSQHQTSSSCVRSSMHIPQTNRFVAANMHRYSLNASNLTPMQHQSNWSYSTATTTPITTGNLYTPLSSVSSYRPNTLLQQSSSFSNFSDVKMRDNFVPVSRPFSHQNSVHNFTYWLPSSSPTSPSLSLNNLINKDSAKVPKFPCKNPDDNLIDFGEDSPKSKYSKENVMESDLLLLFDPLAEQKHKENKENEFENEVRGNVFKDEIDFSKIKTKENEEAQAKENGAKCIKEEENLNAKSNLNNGQIFRVRHRNERSNPEMIHFAEKLRSVRLEFKHNNISSNVGVVISQMLESQGDNSLSVKLVIETNLSSTPVIFTCNVNTSVEHVICHTVCSIFDDVSSVNFDNFVLKVYGLQEYLLSDTTLADYAYVHQCHKFDQDVKLTLINKNDQFERKFSRSRVDDEKVESVTADDLLPQTIVCRFGEVNCESVNILLDTLNKEILKLMSYSSQERCQVYVKSVFQATKALCSLLGNCETYDLSAAVENLSQLFLVYDQYKQDIPGFKIEAIDSVHPEVIGNAVSKFHTALKNMIQLYSKAFPVDFEVSEDVQKQNHEEVIVSNLNDLLLCYIGTVNALSFEWERKYKEFFILCELRHGDRHIAETKTRSTFISQGFFKRLLFDELLNFGQMTLSMLPRESYIRFTLYGVENDQVEASTTSPSSNDREVQTALAFSILKLFDFNETLVEGQMLLGFWTAETVSKIDKNAIMNPCLEKGCPLLVIEIVNSVKNIRFPPLVPYLMKTTSCRKELRLLDHATQNDIYQILNRDPIGDMLLEDKKLLWDRRNYLFDVSNALPKVLKSAPTWDPISLPDIYCMVKNWTPLSAIDAMQLLLPSYPDIFIRDMVIKWMEGLKCDEIIDFLPQLVQALRYDHYLESPLLWFLMRKAYSNVRIAHKLYWLLKENVNDPIFAYNSRIILNALLCTCGEAVKKMFQLQEQLLEKLSFVSETLKTTKESLRLSNLLLNLESVHDFLILHPTPLPISPSMEVTGLDVKSCSYFTSNTLPLKLVFKSFETKSALSSMEAIYKVGDDLRQDMLTMQMIEIMDKLWLRDGLDLKMVMFNVVATDYRKGFVEMVKNSETLRKIQTEYGVTGSFNDRCIASWLQKHNTSELEYQQAMDNFTYSCAGYAVATYILGVCDRHNDNIMITTSGHLFHIDFGKFLGDSQMLGNIKRDRVPFVLTSDMAYVINGGDKPSKQFQYFIDSCCQAFNIIRRHANLFLSLFSLMISSGIPGVTSDAVKYVHKTLHPSLSEAEAMSEFTRMITESLKSRFTQLNFFIHNLAQLRFTGDHNDQLLLSFAPKVYTRENEEKIKSLEVVDFCKKYEPEKQYFFVIKVEREHQLDPSYVLRTYREFCEFYQKLSSFFPLAKFHPLARGSSFGRSNTREAAEKRRSEIRHFLNRLMMMADEVLHSDLVYTFFHPLLRDQEALRDFKFLNISHPMPLMPSKKEYVSIRRGSIGAPCGQVKLSILYKNASLIIMIMHAKNLHSPRSNSPDCYVKTYLLPDLRKNTKRKTKIVFRNSHPTFMEMIVYQMPLDVVQQRMLQVAVWDYDRVQENLYLGACLIPLREMNLLSETVSWYPLEF